MEFASKGYVVGQLYLILPIFIAEGKFSHENCCIFCEVNVCLYETNKRQGSKDAALALNNGEINGFLRAAALRSVRVCV